MKPDNHRPALKAERIATMYRQLRKAQEDAKNEPGAADFYYGEMEMRRHAHTASVVERSILWLYWTISGYGLRASRAIATLLLVLALGTVGFASWGITNSERIEYRPVGLALMGQSVTYRPVSVPDGRPGWDVAAFHAVDSATSLLRNPQPAPVNRRGRVIEIALRFLGPLLLGLAVLAVRNRVKR